MTNRRRLQRVAIFSVLAIALVVFLLVVGAHLAYADYAVPLADVFLMFSLGAWRTFGLGAFVLFVLIEIILFAFPATLIRVQGLAPETTAPQLHVRCRNCGLVDWIEDPKTRPLYHACPRCGTEGEYGGPTGGDRRDFIFTQVQVQLGCTKCGTTYLVPEPMVRPLYTKCPSCETVGILKDKHRPVEAEETELQCYSCGHIFHIYAVRDRWGGLFTCPECQTQNQVPGFEEAAAAGRPYAGDAPGGA